MGLLTRFRKETTMPHTTTAWPEGVVLRYLTVGGATVDIRKDGRRAVDQTATCVGCGASYTRAADITREWAQEHAETCRALPKPTA